ncbi:exodeoxyribonuclease V subunit beta [Halorhodospira halophila]|uniref:exodeoxyribonuclease V subunit beta n=1 Tax=Halorhodospira halophila TaxID=1053 RepID=UPI0019140BDA|nr:exodeoxyribonuclease V subunit beta [Halorhodospira halophila]MBK5935423.1 exodeoxyribonuclease V subunit beta [Halorhodospira halophila]
MAGERLDLTAMPLEGLRLIEASAGTGKTFSLAGLYLRLLIERGAAVHEILVMTFTRAATQELRERIRARLVEAARLAAEPERWPGCSNSEQKLAVTLLRRRGEAEPLGRIAERLRDAASRMDEATITTIHGFAQQAAAENAFDGGMPFDRGEQVEDDTLLLEAATDYWRSRVVGRPQAAANAFLQLWPGPSALHEDLRETQAKPHARIIRPAPDELGRLVQRARELWAEESGTLLELLQRAQAEDAIKANGSLEGALRAHGDTESLLGILEDGLEGTVDGHVALPGWVADVGTEAGAEGQLKKKALKSGLRPHELELVQVLAELQPLARAAAIEGARAEVGERMSARKRARRQFSFADMIEGLQEAITAPEQGEALAQALHRSWPWALVDEFQDTDPLQYEILRRIYAEGGRRGQGGLLMIGDPKQAIYGFRGGDVFAYLRAAADADGCYHLSTNFRSTPGLVQVVETLFRRREQPFLIPGIELQHVAAGRPSGDRRLLWDGGPGGTEAPALTIWRIGEDADPLLTKGEAEQQLEEAAVAQVQHLLGAGVMRELGEDGTEHDRSVAPQDVAVLVNTNQQAAAMQQALSRSGVPAVCLHQASVYATAEAEEVLALLEAVAVPTDEARVRAALATTIEGYRLGDLVALSEDEGGRQAVMDRYQEAQERWRNAGVLALLHGFLQRGAPRVLGLEDGERRLTNYLQLAELLQEAETEACGLEGVIRFLRDAIRDPGARSDAGESDQLRLETDEALVRVTTVHKVKGLEYPVVLVPYAPFLGTMGNPERPPYVFHDPDDGAACLDFGTDAANAAHAVREHKAEGLRLLYVALTRAEQACYLSWGPAVGALDGALAWLLHGEDGVDDEAWWGKKSKGSWLVPEVARQRLAELAAASEGALAVASLPASPGAPPEAGGYERAPLSRSCRDLPHPRPPWRVYSFSRLVGRGGIFPPAAGIDDEAGVGALEGTVRAAAEASTGEDAEEAGADPGSLAAFGVRGPGFGTAFHDLLEQLADPAAWPLPGAGMGPAERRRIAQALRAHGVPLPEAPEPLFDAVGERVACTLHAPLPGIGPLAGVPAASRLAEMEFYLGLGGERLSRVVDALRRAGLGAALPAERQAESLRGLMHGYIDLVVERAGRYYVLDYKTNDLGARYADYGPEHLERAMQHGHYTLQYLIYLVALHRHLGRTLPGYEPHSHLGGACYLFVRGINGEDAETGIYTDRPDPGWIQALDRLLAGVEKAP